MNDFDEKFQLSFYSFLHIDLLCQPDITGRDFSFFYMIWKLGRGYKIFGEILQ